MSSLLPEELLTSPVTALSQLCHGCSQEDRRKILNDRLNEVHVETEATRKQLTSIKESIETTRVKYANMGDLVKTMDQLKCSLEEHIRTVRLNEGSFAGTSAVLEYDNAKERTHTLINVIKALSQLNHAKEVLSESGDDQQRMYDSLVDMQRSYDTLNKFVSGSFDDASMEELKDRFLAWQSAALVFAIQQSDFEKLFEIQKTYAALGRDHEFVSVFRRVSINRLKELTLPKNSLAAAVDKLQNEIQFIYTHHSKVLKSFLSDKDCVDLLISAISEGLDSIDLASLFSSLISEEQNPIELLQKVNKMLSKTHLDVSVIPEAAEILEHKVKAELIAPFRSALTSYILSRVNALDLTASSFRSRVESLKTCIAEILQSMRDVVVECELVFGEQLKQVAQQPIDKGLENFLAKLKAWDYRLDSQKNLRPYEDVISVCSASGQLIYGLNELKEMLESVDPSLSPNTKAALKWNRSVADTALKMTSGSINEKMIAKIKDIKTVPNISSSAANLPSFSTAPHEYITTAGQELLQLFHRLENFFLDDSVSHSFYVAFKKKFDGDELFKKVVAEVANRVMTDFIAAIGEPSALSSETAKQFLADTEFLKDACDDLRTGNTDQLVSLEAQLKARVSTS